MTRNRNLFALPMQKDSCRLGWLQFYWVLNLHLLLLFVVLLSFESIVSCWLLATTATTTTTELREDKTLFQSHQFCIPLPHLRRSNTQQIATSTKLLSEKQTIKATLCSSNNNSKCESVFSFKQQQQQQQNCFLLCLFAWIIKSKK